jgi:hypothetical protein
MSFTFRFGPVLAARLKSMWCSYSRLTTKQGRLVLWACLCALLATCMVMFRAAAFGSNNQYRLGCGCLDRAVHRSKCRWQRYR